jgi:hypothetical protein
MDKMLPLFVCGIAYFFHAMRSFKRVALASRLMAGAVLDRTPRLPVTVG